MGMLRPTDALGGGSGHTIEVHKQEDGSYIATVPSLPHADLTFKGGTEQEAIRIATRSLYEKAMRGEI